MITPERSQELIDDIEEGKIVIRDDNDTDAGENADERIVGELRLLLTLRQQNQHLQEDFHNMTERFVNVVNLNKEFINDAELLAEMAWAYCDLPDKEKHGLKKVIDQHKALIQNITSKPHKISILCYIKEK